MSKINSVKARQVYDSRGFPTVEAEIILDDGSYGFAIVPSGASTGTHEAHELRDENKKYLNKSVLKAVENINNTIFPAVKSISALEQEKIDAIMIDLDGTSNKSNLGANAILAVSMACCKAAAQSQKIELYEHISKDKNFCLPYPMLNIINGGAHANNSLQIQEFMIRPDGAKNFSECMRMSFLVIQNLKKILIEKKLSTNVGDEGGFAPSLNSDEEAFDYIVESIERAGFTPGSDFNLCLDVAANEIYDGKSYNIESNKSSSPDEMISFYEKITSKYPIKSIEDPIFEDDWGTWNKLTKKIGGRVQVVGDDLFVTNKTRLQKGIQDKSANAILIKLNQIGSVTETLDTINLAQKNLFNTIISHRSGDTEDTFIADLAIATNSNQIKTGSLARSERVAKYNRLLRVEDINKGKIVMANI